MCEILTTTTYYLKYIKDNVGQNIGKQTRKTCHTYGIRIVTTTVTYEVVSTLNPWNRVMPLR